MLIMARKISKTFIKKSQKLISLVSNKRKFCVNDKNPLCIFTQDLTFIRCKVKFSKLFHYLNLMTGVLPNYSTRTCY